MKKWQVLLGVFGVSLLVGAGFLLKPIFEYVATARNEMMEVPELRLYLNGISLEDIRAGDKSIKYEDNRLVVEEENHKIEFNDVQVKGRGNSTWERPEKIPLQIKFKRKIDLLGLGERKKYILLANYFDYSFLRNDAMFKITEMLNSRYRSQGKFVELLIDDEYQSMYYLMTKIELGKGGVDIRDEYAGLFELDTMYGELDAVYAMNCSYSKVGECLILKDAVFEDDENMSKEVIKNFIEQFNLLEAAAKERDFKTVEETVDVESFVEYFLISEFAVNPDAYLSSFNFYKNGIDDKIHAGPLWDFDFAFGNRGENTDSYSPEIFMSQKEQIFTEENDYLDTGKLMYYLMEIPEFEEEVARLWREKLSGRKDELLIHISEQADYIKEAALRDEAKWREEAFFESEVEYLLDWIARRYDFFEERYGEKAVKAVL